VGKTMKKTKKKRYDEWPKLAKTAFSVSTLKQNDDDEKAYWLSKTPYERLEAVEIMRQIIYNYDPATTRIEKVLEITQRE
jgi:hypothetical protein